MFTATHRTSYTVEVEQTLEDGTKKKVEETRYVLTPVKLPETLEELGDLEDHPENWPEIQKFLEPTPQEYTVGYVKNGEKWERVGKELPTIVGNFIEGLKLTINAAVRPKPTEAGVTEQDVQAYAESLSTDEEKNYVKYGWMLGNAKAKKSIRDKVIAWKSSK